jgi:hypothetical protein
VLAVDPEPRLDPDASLLIEPGPDDTDPEPKVDADADAEPIGNLPSLSLALFRLVGAAAPAPAPAPAPFAFPFRNAPCSYFLRMYFSSSLSLSSAPVVDGRGKADSLGFQTALAAVLPMERMWTICSRDQSSRVTDLLCAQGARPGKREVGCERGREDKSRRGERWRRWREGWTKRCVEVGPTQM